MEQLRISYRKLGVSSPQADAKVSFIDEKWDQMITLGNVYAERCVTFIAVCKSVNTEEF